MKKSDSPTFDEGPALAVLTHLEKRGLKFKSTRLKTGHDNYHANIFRSDQLQEMMKPKDLEFMSRLMKFEHPVDLHTIITKLLETKALLRLERDEENEKEAKLKWPKSMHPSRIQKLEPGVNFFTFTVKPKRKIWKAALIVLAVIAIFLYPLWPIRARILIFYVVFYFLVVYLIFSLVRLLIYFAFRLAGYEFWVLPNINEDNMSLKPYYSFEKASDGKFGYIMRAIFFVVAAAFLTYLFTSQDAIEGIKEVSKRSHDDLLEWGLEKIQFNFTHFKDRSLTHEDIFDEDIVLDRDRLFAEEKAREKTENSEKDEHKGHHHSHEDGSPDHESYIPFDD